jgi:O-antigen ligase
MDAALAVAAPVRATGVVAVAGLAALAVLAPGARARALSMTAALALTPVLLVGDIWDTPQFRPIRDHPIAAMAALAAGLAGLAAVAWVLDRRPTAFPLLVVAALPFRVPIESGGSTASLLLPLYLVVAAGTLAWAVPRLLGRAPAQRRAAVALEWALLGFVVLYAVQATYSADLSKALENMVFFYVPFALLLALLREVAWSERLLVWCLGTAVGLAVLFAGIGFGEYATRELLFNPKVIASNQFETYFRVNSLFFDPNIYGRFLALVMIGLATVLVFAVRARPALAAAALLAVLWGGLVLTFSQSSFAALLVGLAVLAAARWQPGRTVAVAAAGAVLAAAFVFAFPGALRLDLRSSRSVDQATSGRAELIRGGIDLAGEGPVLGWGSGAFARAFRRQRRSSSERAVSASHTIPITVAAEQGIAGLLAYLALVGAALATLARGARGDPFRAMLLAAFCALLLHTLLYAAFLEDPITWTLLGIGLALARASAPTSTPPVREPALAANAA